MPVSETSIIITETNHLGGSKTTVNSSKHDYHNGLAPLQVSSGWHLNISNSALLDTGLSGPFLGEYVIRQTYNLQETKTVWSKGAESGSNKQQYILFHFIFANGVQCISPILIITATTSTKIIKNYQKVIAFVEYISTCWIHSY